MNWQLIGLSSASAFCGLLFAIFLGRAALVSLRRLTDWIRACPVRAAALMPLVGLLVAYAGTKPEPAVPTAKAVLENDGRTLRFVYDEADYGTKGTNWFSVAEAEAIDPYSENVPWHGSTGTVTKVVFDRSFADYRPAQCGKWLFYFLKLETIENIGCLDTSAATSFMGMFSGCRSLAAIDMMGFDTSNVTDMSSMFEGCSSLVTIYASDKFVTTAVTASSDMFGDCFSLVGGAGTGYDSFNPSDKTYARIDGGRMSDSPGYFTGGQMTIATGAYASLDLVKNLGIVIPPDIDYAEGDKATIKVEGLAKGLKLAQDKTSKAWIVSGVPTEEIDFEKNPMYARVTVTYKDKTKGDKGKVETLQPIVLSITTPDPSVLTEGVLNEVYEPVDIAALWPEVADAKINPKEWSFKGWPAGIKYNATAKDANWSYKDGKTTVKTSAEPWTVYGQPTKAGDFAITATHSYKIGKTSVKETFAATMRVWADGEMTVWEDQAYVATTKSLDEFGTVKSASGLPTGLKFTAKDLTDKTYGEIAANTVYGLPTKAGTFVVTLTLPDPADAKKTVKTSYLWTIFPADAPEFAIDTGTAPVEDMKAQIAQGANQAFSIASSEGAKVTASGLPSGLKLVQDKTTKLYSVEGVASKPGEYFVIFKTVLNGVTTVTTTAFTVKANPFAATYCGYAYARPADGAAVRLGVAEVTVAAAGTVKLTYTEGKTKYTASVKSFDWDDADGRGKSEGLVLKVSSADKNAGYGDRKATVTFEDRGAYLKAKLDIADAGGSSLMLYGSYLFETVKATEIPLPASQTFVFQNEDGGIVDAIATVSVAYDANKATAAFSGKLFDGTAVKVTVPVIRVYDEGSSWDYSFAPFLVIAKDGTVYCFNEFYCWDGGYVEWVAENGKDLESAWADYAEYTHADKKFAELVPETGTFAFGWGSDAEVVGAPTESFTFEVTKDKNNKPAGVAIYDVDLQEDEKPLATVTAKVGKVTGAISVSFTTKKGDKAKYAVELVWRGERLFAGHVTRTWKGLVGGKSASLTAYGTAEVK